MVASPYMYMYMYIRMAWNKMVHMYVAPMDVLVVILR